MAAPTIDPIGPAPSLSDLPNFPARADATLGALPDLVAQINAVVAWLVNDYAAALANGSKAAPSLYFANDPDLGFYRVSPNRLGISASAGLLLDGPLSGLAVTQSATDTTADRLSKVGDFGWGCPAGVRNLIRDDVNNERGTGAYYAFTEAANKFKGVNGPLLELLNFSADYRMQLAFQQGNNPAMGFRAQNEGVWSEWRELFHARNILGPVSQSGGVPTGAIMEHGSGPNGEFFRFAGGLQICTSPVFTFDTNFAQGDGSGYGSGSQTWTYPAAFSFVAGGGATCVSSADVWVISTCGSSSSTMRAKCFEVQTAKNVRAFAIGRWF